MTRSLARISIDYDSVKSVDGHEFYPSEVLKEVLDSVRQLADVTFADVYKAMGCRGLGTPIPQSEIYEVQRLGGTLVPVPSYPDPDSRSGLKSLVDPTLITNVAFELGSAEPLDILVLVTNDKDFVPLMRKARKCGKLVWLFYGERPAAPLLEEARQNQSDKSVDLAELLRNKLGYPMPERQAESTGPVWPRR